MRKPISTIKLSKNLTLSECHPSGEKKHGFWLYDDIQGMNLAMGSPTEITALTEALEYYQRKLLKTEMELKNLKENVNSFVSSLNRDDYDYDEEDDEF